VRFIASNFEKLAPRPRSVIFHEFRIHIHIIESRDRANRLNRNVRREHYEEDGAKFTIEEENAALDENSFRAVNTALLDFYRHYVSTFRFGTLLAELSHVGEFR